ncbi:Autophagy protein 22 [Haplosporangium sp. Z 27]|nr:Autophagy protein 22 [Haplosporangium sp. Z 27]
MNNTAGLSSANTDDDEPKAQSLIQRLFHDNPDDAVKLQPYLQERLTKKKELWGFFLFGFGYFAWSNTTGSLFQPLLVQQVARGASHLSSNLSIPCPTDDSDIPPGDKCVIPFGFVLVEPTSYALLINVVTVWCTLVVSLGTSAFADHGRSSKRLMMTFCTLLALSTSFVFIGPLKPQVWWITGLLVVIGNIFNGATLNFYDAHIPILARHHPTVVKALVDYGENSLEYIKEKVKISTFLSGGASASGFVGGIVLTVMATLVLTFTDASALRTSPPLPEGSHFLTFGYIRIWKTLSQVRRLKTMAFYLCAWFILGDGVTSSSQIAVLYAQDVLQASNDALIIAALIQYVCAAVGMTFWIWLQNTKGVKPMNVILCNSCLFGLIPIYCLLGNIKSNPVGLKHIWELYMVAALFGFFVAAIYSSNRVVFAQFIPLGHENELPLVCTAIIQHSGIRNTWWFLVTQFYVPAAMLFFVNVDEGRQEAVEFYNNELAEKQGSIVADMSTVSTKNEKGPSRDM